MHSQTCCGFANSDAFKHDKVLFIESTCIMIPPCTLQGTSVARAAHGTSCRQGVAASWRDMEGFDVDSLEDAVML